MATNRDRSVWSIISGPLAIIVLTYAAWTSPGLVVAAASVLAVVFTCGTIAAAKPDLFGPDPPVRFMAGLTVGYLAATVSDSIVDPGVAQGAVILSAVIGIGRAVYDEFTTL